jgi:outer membrane protein, adhesin transport system
MRSGRCPIKASLVGMAVILQASCSQTAPKSAIPPAQAAAVNLQSQPKVAEAPTGTKAAPQAVRDTESAVKRVVSWHPAIQEAAGRIQQQNWLIQDARSGYLPSVGGGLDLGAQNDERGEWAPKFNVSASQMIYDFGKVSGRVEAETAIHDVRQAEFLATVDDIIRETALASVEILRNERLAVVAKEQIDDVEAIGTLVELRTDRGASTKSDKLQAEARVQAAQSTALEISAERQRWEGTLNALLGQTGRVRLKGSFPPGLGRACAGAAPNWDTVPNVLAAKSRKREADARVGLARADMLPTIAMEATSRVKTWGSDTDPDYVVGITVKGDLYNGGSFRAKQNAARYAAQASEAAIATGKFDSQKTWIESAAQVSSLSTLLTSLASRQTMMRETRKLYQVQFLDLGTRTLLDVLNADQELHAARFDEINTRYDIYKLNVECAYAAGRLRDVFELTPAAGKVTASTQQPARTVPKI